MKIRMISCAQHTIIDAHTNKLSLVNIYDSLESRSFPTVIIDFSAVVVTEREDTDSDEEFLSLVLSIDGEQIGEGSIHFDYSTVSLHRSIIKVPTLVIPKPGLFEAKLNRGEETLGIWDFPVSLEATDVEVTDQPTE